MSARCLELPHSCVYLGPEDPVEQEDLLEFRLLYQGLLPSSGNASHVPWKHNIRKTFHPQLRRLWSLLPNLRQYATYQDHGRYQGSEAEERFQSGLCSIGENWQRAGYNFVPLVTGKFALRCSLDILLLRPGEEKFILSQGDIDGQVKTLFDSLKMPTQTVDVHGDVPEDDEKPFFCLLEDDRLVSEVHVTTDHLLLLPGEREVKPTDCFAVIHVRINHRHPGAFDRWFD
jgi:hypothetical protein